MKKTGLACGLLSVLLTVGMVELASADTAWIEYGGTYDGLWTDVNHWWNEGVTNAIPGWARLLDTAPVDTATITFPAGEPVVNKMTAIYFAAGSGKRLVLSGEGADFQMPDLEPTKHAKYPLQFAPHISQYNFCIESDSATGSLGRFTNFHFTVDASVPKTGKVLFEGGYYRFDKRMSVLGDNTVSPTNVIEFKDCTLAFDGGFNLQSASPYGRFVLDNVQASSAPGEMTKGSGVGQVDGQVTLTDFLLTNGTEFHYDTGTFAFGQGSYPRAANFHRGKVLHLTIEKGSAFYLNQLENGAGARMVIDVLKDSKLCIMDGAFAPGRGANPSYHTPDWSTGIVNVVAGQLTVRNYSQVDQLGSSAQVDTWGELNVSDGGIAEFYRSQSSETTKWAHDLSCPRGQISVCRSGEIVGGKIIGSSPSRFVSDGGIVRWSGYASDDANMRKNAFEGFGEARIGKGGLLYDSGSTAVETTIAQSFSNLGTDSGTLTCKGLIKLAGQETDVDTIVAASGSLGFASGASPDSSVIVTNGASLRLANLVSLKSLTVGDANSVGMIVLSSSASDSVALPQAPAFVNPVVTAESALAAGTYTPFVCATMTDAEKLAWSRLVMAPEFVAPGLVADFGTEEVADGTALRITVRAAKTLEIVVADGEISNVTWQVKAAPADTISVSVGEEATLTMSGTVGDGALVKDGRGALYLSGLDNYFAFGYSLLGGLLSVNNAGALGFADNTNAALLKDGTLEFTGAGPIRAMTPFNVSCATRYGATAIKANCDVTMPLPQITLGNFVKRGPERLTFEVHGDKTLNLDSNQGHCTARATPPNRGMPVVFDEEYGNVPYSEAETTSAIYTPLTVAEGELRLLGVGETVPKVNYYAGGVYVGIATTCGTVPPQLTLDHVYANFQGGHSFEMSCGYANGFLDKTSSMVITNGATFNLAGQQFLTLYQSAASALTTTVTVVDHSTFRADPTVGDKCDFNASFARGGRKNGLSRYFFRDKSKFVVTANAVSCYGLVEFDFDDSTCDLASTISLDANFVDSIFRFRNGSVFKGGFSGAQTLKTPVLFANAEWQPGRGDIAVGGGTTPTMTIAVEDAGLVLAPAAGETWTLGTTVSGEGGIVNRGEGTLKLTAGNALFTGPLAAEAGVLDLDGGTFANRVITFGGSIENGTLDAPTIRVGLDVAGIVEHPIELDESDGLALTGRVSVDLGRTADDPIVLPMEAFEIGTYVGAAPDVSGWKLVGTGVDNCRGKFAVQSGKITVEPYVGGLIIIVR